MRSVRMNDIIKKMIQKQKELQGLQDELTPFITDTPEETKRKKMELTKRKVKAINSGVQFTHGYQ